MPAWLLVLKVAIVLAGAVIGLRIGLWAERYEVTATRRDVEEEL